MNRASALTLKSHAPFSVAPYLISIRPYNANRLRIGFAEMVTEIKLLERTFIPLLDSVPTVNRSGVRHKNRFLGEERSHGGGIVIFFSVVKFCNERMKLLYFLWISRVFLYCYHCSPLVFFGWSAAPDDLLLDFLTSLSQGQEERLLAKSSLGGPLLDASN